MTPHEFMKRVDLDIAKKYLTTEPLEDEHDFYEGLKRLVDSYELVGKMGLEKSKLAIKNNVLDASYISIWGTYYRYGAHSLYMAADGAWKEIYTGMDSNNLIHLDALKIALEDVEKCR